MLKNKKLVVVVTLILVTILSTSITGQAAGFDCDVKGNSIRGYNINSVLNKYLEYCDSLNNNNKTNKNWQIITIPSNGKSYENIFKHIITIPVRPSQPNVPETPRVPEQPETPVEPEVPEVPEKPEVPKVPEKPEVPKTPEVPNVPNSLSAQELEVVRLVNIERAKAGLEPFTISEKLSNVARLKSKDMAEKGYFSHTSPTYGSPFEMMRQFGINYRTAGENIAKGYLTAQSVVNGWMNSSGHRANILNPSFKTIGVGAYKTSNNTIYWTQMFTN